MFNTAQVGSIDFCSPCGLTQAEPLSLSDGPQWRYGGLLWC